MAIPPVSAPLSRTQPTAPTSSAPPVSAASLRVAELNGPSSKRLLDTQVATAGVVTGVLAKDGHKPSYGVFVQDTTSARKAHSSDGIFVRLQDRPSVAVGDAVTAVGLLRAVEDDGRELAGAVTKTGVAALPAPVRLDLPADARQSAKLLREHRGMLVEMPRSLVLVPTSGYGTFTIRAQNEPATALSVKKDYDGARAGLKVAVSTEYAAERPALTTGDIVEGVVGPLNLEYGEHRIYQQGKLSLTQGPGVPKSMWGDIDADGTISPADVQAIKSRAGTVATSPLDPADLDGNGSITANDAKQASQRAARVTGAPTLRVASLNVENLFDTVDDPATRDTILRPERYQDKLSKIAKLINTDLSKAPIIALQEVENDVVLKDLISHPDLKSAAYDFVWKEGPDPRSIDVALLYRPDMGISVSNVRQIQSTTTVADKDTGKSGVEKPLYMRPPLAVDVDVASSTKNGAPLRLTVIANHFISKASPSGFPSEPMRIEQARHLRDVTAQLTKDDPDRHVVVVGDLNDFDSSETIKTLQQPAPGHDGPSLIDVGQQVIPRGERYTYQYKGSSDAIDHVLVAPALLDKVESARILHLHADSPAGKGIPEPATDHDLTVVDFRAP